METLIKELGYEGGPGMGGRPTVYFTAAECADIAKAYAQANALWRNADTIPERRTLSVEVDAWLAKFAEWEKGQ